MPKDSSLWTLQSALRSSIGMRLDPAQNWNAAQMLLLEEEESRRREKERKKEKREKSRKKREKKKAEKQAEAEAAKEMTNSTDSGNVPDCPNSEDKQDDTVYNENGQNEIDEDEDIDCIFAPMECLEHLDPHDRDVEVFKKFCLGMWLI